MKNIIMTNDVCCMVILQSTICIFKVILALKSSYISSVKRLRADKAGLTYEVGAYGVRFVNNKQWL